MNMKLTNILKMHINNNKKERPGEKALFISNYNKRFSYQGLNAKFSRWMKKLRLTEKGYSLHSCRHFMVRRMQKKGAGVHVISAMCGHASPITTMRVYGIHTTIDDISKENRF